LENGPLRALRKPDTSLSLSLSLYLTSSFERLVADEALTSGPGNNAESCERAQKGLRARTTSRKDEGKEEGEEEEDGGGERERERERERKRGTCRVKPLSRSI
jgi:hypothetical protein